MENVAEGNPDMIRVLLVDDHVLVREALREILEKQRDISVIGEADNGRDGLELALRENPDVVVMDISMPNLNGVDATRRMMMEKPYIKVLALSMHMDRVLVTEMLKAGAKGYLAKHSNLEEMVNAIRTVAGGNTYLGPNVAGMVVDGFVGRQVKRSSPAYTVLSTREREVLQLLAEGKNTREVAKHLNISVSTVESHRRTLKSKLKIDSFAGLVKFAIVEGLTGLDT